MKVKAKITARHQKPEESITKLQALFDDWPGYTPVGAITLVSKYSNGVTWIATATMERELT